MAIQTNFPAIKPTLLLDFANTEALDPRVTFTRASTATYYGTQTAKAEENLFINSQTFGTNWTAVRIAVTSDTTAAPDGTTTADTLTNTTATGAHVIDQASTTSGYSIVSGLTYTISVFAKKSTNDFFQITTFNASNTLGTGRANFNLATGAAGSVDGGTSTITDAGNGWYRCTYTVTASASGAVNIYFGIITTSTAARFESYTGLGTEAIFLWGAQLEQRSAVTAYTATTTQPITNYIPVLETAASGVPRFEHNPITFESLGLEIEESRTNLLTYSEQFDNAAWTKNNASITANTIISPDGTLNGDKVVENTSNAQHDTFQTISGLTAGNAHTFSFFAKAGERSQVQIYFSQGSNNAGAIANLSTGTIGAVTVNGGAWTGGSASITNVGNGWYRISLTATIVGSTALANRIVLVDGSGNTSYTGDGYSGIFIWGASLEAGAFATSYIPTVASQVTRAADAASMTGADFSSWYNAAEGTLFFNGSTYNTSSPTMLTVSNGTATGEILQLNQTSGGAVRFEVRNGGTSQASITTSVTAVANTAFFTAAAYKVNDFAAASNSGTVGTDTSGTTPVPDSLRLMQSGSGGTIFNGTIRKIAYYPLRVTNAQLQALTS